MVRGVVIIVSWNVCARLRVCLQSIFAQTGDVQLDVFVVDNASSDDSVAMMAREFPQVHLIVNNENMGCARAVNTALRIMQTSEAKYEFVLWLNPDMKLGTSTISDTIAVMNQNPDAGIFGIKLVTQTGEIIPHIREFPSWSDQLCIVAKLPKLFPRLLNRYLCREFDYEREAYVPSIRGSYFFMTWQAIEKIGLFDERFFLWFEEVDYCKRAWNAGIKIMYTPVPSAQDFVGQSFAQVRVWKKQKMFIASMMKYLVKHLW